MKRAGLYLSIVSLLLVITVKNSNSDDRKFFTSEQLKPYVMLLLDTTGSMTFRTTSNYTAWASDEDDDSRFWQLKRAIYQVMYELDDMNFGFATFPERDRFRVKRIATRSSVNINGTNYSNIRYSQWQGSWKWGNNYCERWERLNDTNSDKYRDHNLLWPTKPYPPFPTLQWGDVVPMHWEEDNRREIMYRVVPALRPDSNPFDDTNPMPPLSSIDPLAFGSIHRYFKTTPHESGSRKHYHLKNNIKKPLIPFGGTPIGKALRDLKNYLVKTWIPVAQNNDSALAANCRDINIILLTDGDDTCGSFSTALSVAQSMSNGVTVNGITHKIKTYVIGFAYNSSKLNQLAQKGGTNQAYFPTTTDELVDVFRQIAAKITPEPVSFAPSATPPLSSESGNRVFMSSFVPITGYLWPGELAMFVKPLPLKNDGTINKSAPVCSGSVKEGCFAWNIRTSILSQAPSQSQVNSRVYKIGTSANKRRVMYPYKPSNPNTVPMRLSCFVEPNASDYQNSFCKPVGVSKSNIWQDLATGMGYTSVNSTVKNNIRKIFQELYKKKTLSKPVDSAFRAAKISTYVIGDFFHSEPRIIEAPNVFKYFAKDLFGTGAFAGVNPCSSSPSGYRCFAVKNRYRRKMLVVGANDGQLHFFDAGKFDTSTGEFTTGTGRELFSIVPRAAMPMIRFQIHGDDGRDKDGKHVYSMDASIRVWDVYIDPAHNGTPTESDREWRTVVFAAMRKGGIAITADPDNSIFRERVNEKIGSDDQAQGSIIAIDVTYPETPQTHSKYTYVHNVTNNVVPRCMVTNCGSKFPAVLWEFRDQHYINTSGKWEYEDLDEDGNRDFGDPFGTPIITRVKIDRGTGNKEDEPNFVAIFGGGIDHESLYTSPTSWITEQNPDRGNFIYMVDVETGKTIYKREIIGQVAEVTAIDTDDDSYVDYIYFGTTVGVIYKIDVTNWAQLENSTVKTVDGSTVSVRRVRSDQWQPTIIFTVEDQFNGPPIFFRPTIIYVPERGHYALIFGTGDRNDMWRELHEDISTPEIENYVIALNDTFDNTSSIPITVDGISTYKHTNLVTLFDLPDALDNLDISGAPLLTDAGWFFSLEESIGERLATTVQSLGGGILVFGTFSPEKDPKQPCSVSGTSHVYLIHAATGSGIADLTGDNSVDRSITLQSKGAPPMSPSVTLAGSDSGSNTPTLGNPAEVGKSLKQFYPKRSQTGNFYFSIRVKDATGKIVEVAQVPIGVIISNWKAR